MKFRYYIIEPDSPAKGTNNLKLAKERSEYEDIIVIDAENGMQLCDWSNVPTQKIEEYQK